VCVLSTPWQDIAVFLGPSLPQQQARALLEAQYYPPARKGDVYRLLPTGVKTIVLIDGVFHSTPSVWQRELLTALEEGVQVLGAASMGALRAAELDRYGMTGFGTIYTWYRDGVIQGDDEVALRHGDADVHFYAMSEPLVNIRCTLQQAVHDGVLTVEQATTLIAYAKHLYYPDRSYAQVLRSPVLQDWPQPAVLRLAQYVRTQAINLKARDAAGVLQYCATQPASPSRARVHPTPLQETDHLWLLARGLMAGFRSPTGDVRGERVLRQAMRDEELVTALRRPLAMRAFVLAWARQHQITCPASYQATFLEQWGVTHGLGDAAHHGLHANGLTSAVYQRLVAERALVAWVTTQDPCNFGLAWRFPGEVALDEALQRAARAAGRVLPEASDPPQRDVYTRRVLRAWAHDHGMTYPVAQLAEALAQAAQTFPADAFWLAAQGYSMSDYQQWLSDWVLVEWMLQQGPGYFGLLWVFEGAVLYELQMTGRAARYGRDDG
jgi:hypothetical protein